MINRTKISGVTMYKVYHVKVIPYTVLGKSLDALAFFSVINYSLAFFSVINYSLAYSIKSKRS